MTHLALRLAVAAGMAAGAWILTRRTPTPPVSHRCRARYNPDRTTTDHRERTDPMSTWFIRCRRCGRIVGETPNDADRGRQVECCAECMTPEDQTEPIENGQTR